jgi:pimeloyl-ACP methyl ester carboxylesterase
MAVLAIGYTPRGRYEVPSLDQCRRWWYQWLMTSEAGAMKVASDPLGFARTQWDTWSPPGWYTNADFESAASSFDTPDWVAITLHGYRHRWQPEALDARYALQRAEVDAMERLGVPTLMIQGGDDRCDPREESEGQEQWFTGGYQRIVVDGAGHFPAREAPVAVAGAVIAHLAEQGYAQ